MKDNSADRVLHVVGGLSCGGAETMVMNLYRKIDRNKIQFDFYAIDVGQEYYEEEIAELGGRVFKTVKRSESLIRYCGDLYRLLRTNRYQIIHIHSSHVSSSLFAAVVGWLAGVKVRVCHSHSSYCEPKWQQALLRPVLNLFINERLSCGELAGRWMYGKRSFQVFPLPVDCKRFLYDEEERAKQREHLKYTDEYVYGHIGRLEYEKNHVFLLDIFYEIQKWDSKARLVLFGDGGKAPELLAKVKALNLDEKVVFMGRISDVYKRINLFDEIIFPSLYEGLPTVILEAQANGIPCFLSDTITKEIQLTDLVKFISLEKGAEAWAEEIIKSRTKRDRKKYNAIIAKRYDCITVAQQLERFYLERLGK